MWGWLIVVAIFASPVVVDPLGTLAATGWAKKEHDDDATDRQGCVGRHRQAGLDERTLRPKDKQLLCECRKDRRPAQRGSDEASKLAVEPGRDRGRDAGVGG